MKQSIDELLTSSAIFAAKLAPSLRPSKPKRVVAETPKERRTRDSVNALLTSSTMIAATLALNLAPSKPERVTTDSKKGRKTKHAINALLTSSTFIASTLALNFVPYKSKRVKAGSKEERTSSDGEMVASSSSEPITLYPLSGDQAGTPGGRSESIQINNLSHAATPENSIDIVQMDDQITSPVSNSSSSIPASQCAVPDQVTSTISVGSTASSKSGSNGARFRRFSFEEGRAAIEDTSRPLEEFTCFPKLPLELRWKIWREIDLARTPRTFVLNARGSIYKFFSPPGILFFVNLEARREMYRLNPPLSFIKPKSYACGVRFNSNVDIISFMEPNWMSVVKTLNSKKRSGKELEKIKRVSFEATDVLSARHRMKQEMERQYRALPNLVEIRLNLRPLYLAIPEELTEYDIAALCEPGKNFIELHRKLVSEGLRTGMWKGNEQPRIRVFR